MILVQGQLRQKLKTLSEKQTESKRISSMAEVVKTSTWQARGPEFNPRYHKQQTTNQRILPRYPFIILPNSTPHCSLSPYSALFFSKEHITT
jgi:hypothetical protein